MGLATFRPVPRLELLSAPLRTWSPLRDAIDILLEATPKGIDMAKVRSHILEAPGVADVHDLHAWTSTSGVNVVSAHVVLDPEANPPAVLDHLCDCLSGQFDIEHSTFQLAMAGAVRLWSRRGPLRPRPQLPALRSTDRGGCAR